MKSAHIHERGNEPDVTPPFIAVEGNAGVGKSTTIRALSDLTGCDWFPEYLGYFDPGVGDVLPPFPPARADVPRSNALWPTLDLRRERDRGASARASRAVQLVDTSSLSVLGYELALVQRGLPNGIRELAGRYLRLYRSGELREPAAWLLLRADPCCIARRMAARTVPPGTERTLLAERTTMDFLDRFRAYFHDHYVAPDRRMVLVNDHRSAGDVARLAHPLVLRIRDGRSRSLEPTPLQRLLEDLLDEASEFWTWL